MVLLGHILQAAGAAVIPATAMIIPARYFPDERRGRALGMSATGLAIGAAVGPVVTPILVSFAHWRWLLCIPLLILATLPFYRKYLGNEKGAGGRIAGSAARFWPGRSSCCCSRSPREAGRREREVRYCSFCLYFVSVRRRRPVRSCRRRCFATGVIRRGWRLPFW